MRILRTKIKQVIIQKSERKLREYVGRATVFPLVRLVLPIIYGGLGLILAIFSRAVSTAICRSSDAIPSYLILSQKKYVPSWGIELATTWNLTHMSLTTELLSHDITVTLYGYMDSVVTTAQECCKIHCSHRLRGLPC